MNLTLIHLGVTSCLRNAFQTTFEICGGVFEVNDLKNEMRTASSSATCSWSSGCSCICASFLTHPKLAASDKQT